MSSPGRQRYSWTYQQARASYFARLIRTHGEIVECGICGQPLDLTLTGRGPAARSIDHAIPVGRGGPVLGEAGWRPVHNLCNSKRGARILPLSPTPPPSREW